jgi:hypothetical protein
VIRSTYILHYVIDLVGSFESQYGCASLLQTEEVQELIVSGPFVPSVLVAFVLERKDSCGRVKAQSVLAKGPALDRELE